MKERVFLGFCFLFFFAGVAFAQDKMIILFKDGTTQIIQLDKIERIEYQTAPAQAKTYTWTFQRIGDCHGNDINSTRGSAVPSKDLCNEKTVGLTAVCWEGGCTYKSIQADKCTGGRNPGNLYKCMGASAISQEVQKEGPLFDKPTYKGYRLDLCRVWGGDCGKGAADAFCRAKGYAAAESWEVDPDIGHVSPTIVMSTEQICNQSFCDGFKFIKCTGP